MDRGVTSTGHSADKEDGSVTSDWKGNTYQGVTESDASVSSDWIGSTYHLGTEGETLTGGTQNSGGDFRRCDKHGPYEGTGDCPDCPR